MGIGAIFGAMLTMYTAVATRTREIATLRALGFNTFSVLVLGPRRVARARRARRARRRRSSPTSRSTAIQTSTMNFQTFSQVAFAFRVTPSLLVLGLVYALVMGFIGGLFPAIRAARCRSRKR